jgi:choline dehydrogenase-like flavoprotein
MTVAMELADSGCSVCLLESGGSRYDRRIQRFNEGRVSGNSYPPLRDTRLSAFGGSTKLWAGWCRPLDPLDFEPRDWVADSGWPFGPEDLLTHYRRAHEICRLGPFEYDPAFWRHPGAPGPLPIDDGVVRTTMFHVNRLDFGDVYRRRFEETSTVRVLLYASALRLHVQPTSESIESVSAATAGAVTFSVTARYFVLAGGGIENARILMLSGDTPARSVGNAHGLVGRYFTEHAFIHPGYFIPTDRRRSLAFYFPMAFEGMPRGAAVRAGFSLSRGTLESERLLNAAFVVRPAHEGHRVFDSREVTSMLELWEKLRGRGVPGGSLAELHRAMRAPHRLALAAWRKLTIRGTAAPCWGLRAFFEAEPRASNRITLSHERDALGRPLPHIEWRLTDLDIRSVRRGFHLLDRALRDARVGHLELRFPDDMESWNEAAFGGKHHMGTTRMHVTPGRGVVDAHGKVHGVHNLFVAGSSVFPTAGFVNPTLSIVALAARLGAHLRDLLEGEVPAPSR